METVLLEMSLVQPACGAPQAAWLESQTGLQDHSPPTGPVQSLLTVPVGVAQEMSQASTHTWSVVAVPGVRTPLCPHEVHGTQAVAGSPSLSQSPVPQGTAGWSPPAQYSPERQGWHTAGLLAVAAAVCTDPAEQPVEMHSGWFAVVV